MRGGLCAAGLAAAAVCGPGAALAQEPAVLDEVIVTGTRMTGLRAVDSPAPIEVLEAASLRRSGPTDLIAALAQAVPSFNAQAVAGDTANLTLAARLRGLSPNHVLVLVNGKRRHGTSNLAILSSAYQGGAGADLNFIPVGAIQRIEVLTDGAAAQYGSDAIAGVINIILKSSGQGGSLTGTAGAYMREGGATAALEGDIGLGPWSNGFLNLAAESRYHDYSQRGGPDRRVVQAVTSGAHPDWATLADYPYVNRIFGDARYQLNIASYNAGLTLGGVDLYSFGTYGRKYAGGWANFRTPDRLPQIYPRGFMPIDTSKEEDYAITGGARGRAGGWNLDLSSTYGQDFMAINVTRSANIDLYNDTGFTPTEFHAGSFVATQWTTTLDATRELALGDDRRLTLAVGGEYRRETYGIKPGDPASRYKAGSQSYPGFALTDAGRYHRSNWAGYVDAALAAGPVTVDLAGRYEHFSDFGSASVARLTGRYDVSSRLAFRGTASTGFRAPTLAEERYSATNVQPFSAFVQLPPNAAAAKLIGIEPLDPEKSTNFSLGMVARPSARLLITADAYQIRIRNRVAGSGTLYGTYNGEVRSQAVNLAIIANGNVLENVPFTGVNVFTNGIDTRTRGAEVVVTWASDHGRLGHVDWSVAANYNRTKITRIKATPAVLAASGQSLFDLVATSTLEDAAPRMKLVASALWRIGRVTVNLRETFYGQSQAYADPGDGRFYLVKAGAKAITDLDVGYQLNERISLNAGAANLFDVYPNRTPEAVLAAEAAAGKPAIDAYPAFSPFGIDGGYYYGKVRYAF
jgi:iron complex outermembrane receptor protein